MLRRLLEILRVQNELVLLRRTGCVALREGSCRAYFGRNLSANEIPVLRTVHEALPYSKGPLVTWRRFATGPWLAPNIAPAGGEGTPS